MSLTLTDLHTPSEEFVTMKCCMFPAVCDFKCYNIQYTSVLYKHMATYMMLWTET